MFDFWKNVFKGFGGKLKHNEEARTSVWLLIVVGFFSLCCIFFAAYVSYTRYLDLIGFIEGAQIVAMCFTVGIALYMFFGSARVAAFIAQYWTHGSSHLSWQFTILMFLSLIAFGFIDYNMNMDGAKDVAERAAGTVQAVRDTEIMNSHKEMIDNEKRMLADLLAGKNGGYGWKDSKTGVFHLNQSGKRYQRAISANIETYTRMMDDALKEDRQRFETQTAVRDDRRNTTHSRLVTAVRSVYFLQFVLCLVMAFIGVKMSEANNDETEHKAAKSTPGYPSGISFNPAGYQDSKIGFKSAKSEGEKVEKLIGEIVGEIAALRGEINAKKNSPEKPEVKGVKEGGKKMPENSPPELMDKGVKNSPAIHTHQRELYLDNTHPKFSKLVQPDKIRGIDEKKYKQFVKAAKKVKAEHGRYNKSEIHRSIGGKYETVTKYLKVAIELRKDLEK